MADDNQAPVFQIQRIYLKDLSLEQPNSPKLLLEMTPPQVDINLGVGAETIAENTFEVTLTATVTAKIGDKVLFLVEAKQAGIFEIKNIPKDQMQPVVSTSGAAGSLHHRTFHRPSRAASAASQHRGRCAGGV